MALKKILRPGEPAPWFTANCTANPNFQFDSAAGRYVVLCFFGSASLPTSRTTLDRFTELRKAFDDVNAVFFGVSNDPDDRESKQVEELLPGMRFFWDFDWAVSRLYGAAVEGVDTIRPHTLILDPRLRVLAVMALNETPGHADQVVDFLRTLPPFGPPTAAAMQAPALVVPHIFEPQLCRLLIDYYEQHGGEESGFMRDVAGRTVGINDPTFKRRRDQDIADERLRAACMHRIHDRLVPEMHKAFQFRATRIERYLVACYDSANSGFFRAHRDNTTKGTAHRRFAVSLNLNTGEYAGGCLRFPEFGNQLYIAPAGGAVVFSCSLLHEATPVTTGKRYAFLPFLYDDEAARIRQQNSAFVDARTFA